MKLAATLCILVINLFANDLSIQDLGKITENFYIEYSKNKHSNLEAIKANRKNINSNSNEIALLKLQIEKLQNTISTLQKNPQEPIVFKPKEPINISPQNIDIASVPPKVIKKNSVIGYRNGALLKNIPIDSSKTITTIPYQTSIDIVKCNQFGWCYTSSFNGGWIKKYTLLKR
jgi:hypothetical protein